MKNALIISLLLIASSAHAADETQVLLEAPRVDSTVVLTLDGQSVRFSSDNGRVSGAVTDGTTFAAARGVTFLFHDYHPLRQSIVVTVKKEDEPVTKGATEFIDALLATTKALPGFGAGAPGLSTPLASSLCDKEYADCESKAIKLAAEVKRVSELQACKQAHADCTACAALKAEVSKAASAAESLSSEALSDDERSAWTRDAVGVTGIAKVKNLVDTKIRNINANLKILRDARTLLLDFKNLNSSTTVRGIVPGQLCSFDRSTMSALSLIADSAGEMIVSRQQLSDNLAVLSKALEKYGEPKNWSSTDPTDYILLATDSDYDKKTVITFKMTPVALSANGSIVANDAGAVTRETNLRGYRRLVPEFGVAAVWNDLKYPKYKAKDENGVKTVAENGFDSSNVNAAATVNLLCNCFGGRFVYPGLQLGVSKAKDYPGLMAGFVFRFVGARRFSVAVGEMVTWYKDLDKLKVDSPIGSENDIKADLSLRRSPTTFYVAAQYNF
jgi:hypothetical protein